MRDATWLSLLVVGVLMMALATVWTAVTHLLHAVAGPLLGLG